VVCCFGAMTRRWNRNSLHASA